MHVKRGRLDHIHERLCLQFKKRLSTNLLLTFEEGRKRKSEEDRVKFWLSNKGARELTQRKVGETCPVYILPGFNRLRAAMWAGWYEEWDTKDGKNLEFVGASMSFFWGVGGYQQKQLVLRAEWDKVVKRGGNAAQPHWHIDTTLMVEFGAKRERGALERSELPAEEPERTPPELEELAPEPGEPALEEIGGRVLQDVDVSKLHLAMGGWRNSPSYPDRWQCKVDGEDALVEWADCTLEYTIDQFQGFAAPDDVVPLSTRRSS